MPSHPDRVRRNYDTMQWCSICNEYFDSQEELNKHLDSFQNIKKEDEPKDKLIILEKYSE